VSPVDRVVAALQAGGVAADVRRFDVPVPTAAAAAAALGCEVGAIANSLVFDADGAPLLVLASGAHRVDTAKVAALVGAERVRRATAEFVSAATGQEVGGVAPVGHPRPLRTVVDIDLAGHPLLWAGGGDHHTMFAATY
jgi:prolyl-tRNA editing enzyme YbaK/EbsC (Cys-tRNA(Pro) deacylase)